MTAVMVARPDLVAQPLPLRCPNTDPRAACRGAPVEWFVPDIETPYPDPVAKAYCDRCPIRAECLSWALVTREVGIWGGLTTYQRKQLLSYRERRHCPDCAASQSLVTDHETGVQVCLACGTSWDVTTSA